MNEPILFCPYEIDRIKQSTVKGFAIPIYQRLYAWSRNEIIKLLVDIKNTLDTDSEKEYYVGNLTLSYNETSFRYDIIDGQQRITTLWLLAIVLKIQTGRDDWDNFLGDENELLLSFTARKHDNAFLTRLVRKKSFLEIAALNGEEINPMMIAAIGYIRSFLIEYEKEQNLIAFSNYVLKKVFTAAIFLPKYIDLNKYFEDLNNRGLQLEPHHIVKAILLKEVPDQFKSNYAAVWDAVAQMNQYIEYGFEGLYKETRSHLAGNKNIFFSKAEGVAIKSKTLMQIIQEVRGGSNDSEKEKRGTASEDGFDSAVNSSVDFPEFLLHCLRLFSRNKSTTIDDKRLVEAFRNEKWSNGHAEKFIRFLLNARVAFDDKFIKSNTSANGTFWEIRTINDGKGEYSRSGSVYSRPLIQIQSMLNASTAAASWFTEALKYSMDSEFTEDGFIEVLTKIDREIHPVLPLLQDLNKGTQVTRYWFYKLDYLLWLKWQKGLLPSSMSKYRLDVDNFQFRDNRSVEHIHPQNPEQEDWTPPITETLQEIKDKFGNLALISASSNSSYRHQDFENKKSDFVKRTRNWGIESLKLMSIYNYDNWSIENMEKHGDEMYSILQEAYKSN